MNDPGVNWIKNKNIEISSNPEFDHLKVLTPRVIQLPDGGYRMYYMGKDKKCLGYILSAYSSNLTEWKKEVGVRINSSNEKGIVRTLSPDIVSLDSGYYRMYYQAHFSNKKSVIMSAFSDDLLLWRQEKGDRIESTNVNYGTPKCVKLSDGSYRLYFHQLPQPFRAGLDAKNNIRSAISSDGLQFKFETGARIEQEYEEFENYSVYAPEVVPLSNGSYRMYYSGWTVQSIKGTQGQIFAAISKDGLAWKKEDQVILSTGGKYDSRFSSEPCIIPLDNNKFRMFYEACDKFGRTRILSADSV